FFFSSRRRHTRSYGDWSSDVCSSDLIAAKFPGICRPFAVENRPAKMPSLPVLSTSKGRRAIGIARLGRLSPRRAGRYTRDGRTRSEERRVGKEWRGVWWWVQEDEKV